MLDSEHVAALRAQGHTFRAIAAQLGASLGAVQRAVKRREREVDKYPDEFDDDLDDEYAFDDNDEPVLVPPFLFVGMERWSPGDGHPWTWEPRWVDANGQSCNELDIYRLRYRDPDYRDPDDGPAVDAEGIGRNMAQQIAAAGWVQADNPHNPGHWRWVQAEFAG
jgi:hypothetical protein